MPLHTLALVALALAPARPGTEPPPPLLQPPPADPRAAAARSAYASGDYVAAARQYEALARDTAAPRYLFNAGMAREAAGELAHATLQWRRYLSSGTASADDRELLTRKLSAAAAALVPRQLQPAPEVTAVSLGRDGRDALMMSPSELADAVMLEAGEWTAQVESPGGALQVRFTVGEPGAGPVALPAVAVRVDPPPRAPEPSTGSLTVEVGPPRALRGGVQISLRGEATTREATLRTATATWVLPRGAWTVSAAAPDRAPVQRSVSITATPQRLGLSLRLSTAARRQRIFAPAILGGVGLGLVAGGVGLAVHGDREGLACVDAATCEAIANSVLDSARGAAMIGAGIGAVIPAATAAADARPQAFAVEAGVGAALLAGGVSWYLTELSQTSALEHQAQKYSAAAMLGIGAGMAGSAVVQLLVRRAIRAKTRKSARLHDAKF